MQHFIMLLYHVRVFLLTLSDMTRPAAVDAVQFFWH